jgi:mxaJ protein
MSSPCRDGERARWPLFLFALASAAAMAGLPGAVEGPLRVCADPDNAPFSTRDERGFENRIAALVARELGTDVRYYWWPQRRGFLRNTLQAGVCDVVVGVPAAATDLLTTPAYYRAGYVFVYRPERVGRIDSYDDPRLRALRIGVPLVGNDMAATPPGAALAHRGLVDNVVGYPPLGSTPVAERMIAALADGTLDVALLWAPQATYFAHRQELELALAPARDPAGIAPAEFAMAMGVRRDDAALRDALAAALERLRPRVGEILRDYGLDGADARQAALGP